MHPAFYSWWKHARRHALHDADTCHRRWRGHGQSPSEGGFCVPGRGGDDGPPFGHGLCHGHGHGPGHGHGGQAPGGGGRFGGGPPDDGGFFGARRPLRFFAHKLELTDAQVSVSSRASSTSSRPIAPRPRSTTGAPSALREAVTLALSRIHALLEEEQRKRLSYLIRTGVVSS